MRALLSALAWSVLASDLAAFAQPSERVYRIGGLELGEPNTPSIPMEKQTGPSVAYREVLQGNGFVLGKNLVHEIRTAQGDAARLPAEAAALVAAKVDVIVTIGTAATVAALQATK